MRSVRGGEERREKRVRNVWLETWRGALEVVICF